jgi:hypothetical protein
MDAGDVKLLNTARICLGLIARLQGDHGQAARYYAEGLATCREAGDLGNLPICLEGLAAVAVDQANPGRAATLLGAAKAAHEVGHIALVPLFEQLYQGTMDKARAALGDERFAAAWVAGRALPLDQV